MANGYKWNRPLNEENINLVEGENLIYRTGQDGAGVGTARMAAEEARRFEQDMATGRLSQAQTQMQQGLGQSRRQQAAMAAGGGAMGQRAAMLAGGMAGAQVAGQSARLRAQEEAAARQQSLGTLGQVSGAEAGLDKLKTMQSVAQASHHMAQQAENRAQEEADRSFGMEVLGALGGIAGGIGSLAAGGAPSPGPTNPDGSYKNPESYGYPTGYTQAQHLNRALTSDRSGPSPMAQAMAARGGFDTGFAQAPQRPAPATQRQNDMLPGAPPMQGGDYETATIEAREYVPERLAAGREGAALSKVFEGRPEGGPRSANLSLRPSSVEHGSPELRKSMYLAVGERVPAERSVPLPDQTLEMQGASEATPSPMVRMQDGSLREVRTDEGLPEEEVSEEEQKASLQLLAEDDGDELEEKKEVVSDAEVLGPLSSQQKQPRTRGVRGAFARGRQLGESLASGAGKLAGGVDSSMYKKTPSETGQKTPAEKYGFRQPPPEAVDETLNNLHAYDYTYKSDENLPSKARGYGLDQMGSRRGPMAEELRATPLGEKAVVDGPTGDMIDNNNYLYGVVTPGLTRVNDKVEELARKLEEYDQMFRRRAGERGK